jgi:predicted GIY-YIG superfamily endonuclease
MVTEEDIEIQAVKSSCKRSSMASMKKEKKNKQQSFTREEKPFSLLHHKNLAESQPAVEMEMEMQTCAQRRHLCEGKGERACQ